jgi:hypothetical protein
MDPQFLPIKREVRAGVLLAPQHDDRRRTNRIARRQKRGLVSRFNDVFWARPRGIYDAPPFSALAFGHGEAVIFPIPVDHHV